MFSLLGKGEFKKRILPGSEKVISNSENTSFMTPLSNHEYFGDDRNYVNAGLEEYEDENQKYKEVMCFFQFIIYLINYPCHKNSLF